MTHAQPSISGVPVQGLSQAEAEQRLSRDGPNELPDQGPRSLVSVILQVLAEPMFLLLLAAAAIYIVLGDLREAVVLAISILVVVAITIVQERRTDQALAKLRDLSSPRAHVVRDGVERRIAAREVVAGDTILLHEGDRVPADAILRSATALSADESLLTGESLPAEKDPGRTDDEASRVYCGSLVVAGFGIAEVTDTGPRTEMGKIGRALSSLPPETTPLFQEVRRLVRWVAAAALALCAFIAIVYGASRHDWLGGVLAGITLAMGILPEEFPVVLMLFLAMGAWRISRVQVLTRRMPAIETIGAATLLAVDKTGTLTENRMRVALIETSDACIDLRPATAEPTASARQLLETASAASERMPFDPMERAIHEAAARWIPERSERLQRMELVGEYDLTPELPAVTHVWRESHQGLLTVAMKGAPEAVAEVCRLEATEREALMKRVARYADQGLRVLAVARGTIVEGPLPRRVHDFDLRLEGLLCLADPLRGDVQKALAECAQAGIRVVMITGDHPGTALAIAAQAGFDTRGGAITGAEIEALSDDELRSRSATVNIYARAKPQHKLRLVQAFKANDEVVVMTGDGVNDAPALKSAHVGVAMGARGTDVAREAAALVLVNDDFNSLVAAVRLGRRIYGNIRHAMSYIVSVHIPMAGLGLIPVLAGWPLLFFPMHVLFLEFVIDPACAFVFEADAEPDDIMRRRPRRPDEPLFSSAVLTRSLYLGTIVLVLMAVLYGAALGTMPEPAARALAFAGLIAANLALIFVSRSRTESLATIYSRPNAIFWWIVVFACGALLMSIHVPPIAAVFGFATPPIGYVLAVTLAAVVAVLAFGRWLGGGIALTGERRAPPNPDTPER
jgi:Ca2+-transporting ATPase